MSYIRKKGIAAVEAALAEESNRPQKVLFPLKSGTSVKVRVPSAEDIVEVWMHSVYDVFLSTPCMKNDYYDQAAEILYKDAKGQPDEQAKETRRIAGLLKAKPRYLMGFFNLDNGQPIIIDLSKKQAQGVLAPINKYEKKLDKLAFELSKTGSGQSTTVTLNVLIDPDEDLNDEQRKHFDETAGKPFPEEIYGNCLYTKQPAEQLEDIREFERKFKVNLLERMDIDPAHLDAHKEKYEPMDIDDEDMPF